MTSENKKRIVKNTTMLYFRMMLTMAISLYTSRVILNSLGVVDFGIYNVVGGIVLMFSFLSSSMATATQRFLSYEIGKNDRMQLQKVFCMSINIHMIIALTILILAETIGLWFLNTKMNIPVERMNSANWVYQFSIYTFLVSIISVPYNAMIIAHEKMNIYAYISIIEAMLKLSAVFILISIEYDKLKIYSILVFSVSIIIFTISKGYNKLKFPDSKYYFFWDKTQYSTLMNYAAWNLFGNVASVTMGQGINILLNLFFGPVVNTARGIAYQVNGAINGFVSNFQMAINPQIIKSFASQNITQLYQLIFHGSKYSFFLLYIATFPIILEMKIILIWWLNNVPELTVLFCRLVLVVALIDSISGPIGTAVLATGKIKKYHSIVGGLQLSILPISYLLLRLGYAPQITLYISIAFSMLSLFARLIIISPLIALNIGTYIRKVIQPIILTTIISAILPLSVYMNFGQGVTRLLLTFFLSTLSITVTIFFFGLNGDERISLKFKLKEIRSKFIIYANE